MSHRHAGGTVAGIGGCVADKRYLYRTKAINAAGRDFQPGAWLHPSGIGRSVLAGEATGDRSPRGRLPWSRTPVRSWTMNKM